LQVLPYSKRKRFVSKKRRKLSQNCKKKEYILEKIPKESSVNLTLFEERRSVPKKKITYFLQRTK